MTIPNDLRAQALLDTPLGPMRIAATDRGLAGLWFDAQKHHPGELVVTCDPMQRWLAQAARELDRFWREPRTPFRVPLDLRGTPFQLAVWNALTRIPPGATTSYGALATALGRPAAVRAVAAAVGRNPVAVIVPCHRVLGRDGSLTGYAAGLDRKQALLKLEGALSAPAAAMKMTTAAA